MGREMATKRILPGGHLNAGGRELLVGQRAVAWAEGPHGHIGNAHGNEPGLHPEDGPNFLRHRLPRGVTAIDAGRLIGTESLLLRTETAA